MEILIRLLARSLFLSPIGKIYLWIKYRDKDKIKVILKNDYHNRYSNAGLMMFGEAFGIIFLCLIAMLIMGSAISIFKFGIGD